MGHDCIITLHDVREGDLISFVALHSFSYDCWCSNFTFPPTFLFLMLASPQFTCTFSCAYAYACIILVNQPLLIELTIVGQENFD